MTRKGLATIHIINGMTGRGTECGRVVPAYQVTEHLEDATCKTCIRKTTTGR